MKKLWYMYAPQKLLWKQSKAWARGSTMTQFSTNCMNVFPSIPSYTCSDLINVNRVQHTFRNGITNGLRGKFVASWSCAWNSSMDIVEFWNKNSQKLTSCLWTQTPIIPGVPKCVTNYFLTTRFITSPRTLSPISGEISEPNCCRVVRNRFNLLSCRAPQAGGSWVTLFPILLGDTGPVGLVCAPLTAGEVELLRDLTSATTGTEVGFAFGDDTGGPWGGWAAGSVGESGMLASLKSTT